MRKSLFIILVFALLVVGCTQQILTWTPTQQEWAAMTPEQRNAWSANEIQARRYKWKSFNENIQANAQRRRTEAESSRIIIVPKQNSTEWQERNARDELFHRSLRRNRVENYLVQPTTSEPSFAEGITRLLEARK